MSDQSTELARLKWLLGQSLILLSLWTVSALDIARGPVLVFVFLFTVLVTAAPRVSGWFSGPWQRFGVPLLILFFIGDVVLSAPEVLVPLVRLLLILSMIRAATYRTHREDLQLMLLGMFLSVFSGVFTLSMLFAVQAFLFASLSIGLLYLVNLLDAGDPQDRSSAQLDQFSWTEFLRWARVTMDLRMFRSLVALMVLLMATTGLLFVAIPRVYLDQSIPFLRLSAQAQSGFSDTVRLGDVTSIQEDNSIAMRVDVPGISSVQDNPYFRMVVLDQYEGGVFRSSIWDNNLSGTRSPQTHTLAPYPQRWFRDDSSGTGTWTFYMQGGVSNYLPVLGPFGQMRFQGRQSLKANAMLNVFRIPETTSSVFSYQVEDFLVGPSIPGSYLDNPLMDENVTTLIETSEGTANRYPYSTLALPVASDEKEFLESMVAGILVDGEESPVEKAQAISRFLQESRQYSLSPGRLDDGDPVVQWLREGRSGHCELFAGAFTLLARTAGVPTRVIAGFSGGSWNSYEDFFVVRNRNAHAWCEIFDGEAWVRFDPTPGGGAEEADGTGAMAGIVEESDFSAWIDGLRVVWFRRVINFDETSQKEIVEGVSGVARELGAVIKEWVSAAARGVWASFTSLARDLRHDSVVWGFLAGFAALAGLLSWMAIRLHRFLFPPSEIDRIGPLRRRAARELARLERRSDALKEEDWKSAREALLSVRFGRNPDPQMAQQVFLQARNLMRTAPGK